MNHAATPLFGAIEAGGTKFVCAVGTSTRELLEIASIATGKPDETIASVMEFFAEKAPDGLAGIGVGAFGPIDVDPSSPTYGTMLPTPKAHWGGFNYIKAIGAHTDAPVAIDTDVNAAARGELAAGAATDLSTFLYLTVGTGVGGGMMVDGRPLIGAGHPEMGHVSIPRAPGDTFAGSCPFHSDCLEGMASGPAIEHRWGLPGGLLGEFQAQATEVEAWYLGIALADFTLTLAPQRIILGGGVSRMEGLIERVRDRMHNRLNGYVHGLAERSALDTFVVPPGLGDRSGITGALDLAKSVRKAV
jgi:fructokinase